MLKYTFHGRCVVLSLDSKSIFDLTRVWLKNTWCPQHLFSLDRFTSNIMKILMVTLYYKPLWEGGGPPRVVYETSKRLVERGHEVTVYTTNFMNVEHDLPTEKPMNVDGVTVYYFENFRRHFPKSHLLPPLPIRLPEVAKKEIENFDIIHIHEHRTALAAIVASLAMKHKVPYVIQPHGSVMPFFQKQRQKILFDKLIGNDILSNASLFLAMTQTETEQLVSMDADSSLIRLIPNGIDDSECACSRGSFRQRIGLKDEPMALYLARFHRIKGPDLLIESFSKVIERFPTAKLVMIGPDDGYLDEVKRVVDREHLASNVILLGPIYDSQQKRGAYLDADVYVLPSRYELFPVSVLESWAAGTPVIVTDQCGIRDLIQEAGIVVPFEKDKLATAIESIFSDNSLGKAMGREGRATVLERYTWSKVVDYLEELYLEIIN